MAPPSVAVISEISMAITKGHYSQLPAIFILRAIPRRDLPIRQIHLATISRGERGLCWQINNSIISLNNINTCALYTDRTVLNILLTSLNSRRNTRLDVGSLIYIPIFRHYFLHKLGSIFAVGWDKGASVKVSQGIETIGRKKRGRFFKRPKYIIKPKINRPNITQSVENYFSRISFDSAI
jgi:hypothetical protein